MAKGKRSNSSITRLPDPPVTGLLDGEPQTPISALRALAKKSIPILPYQDRWIMDDSQLKIAVWSRQSGKSFAAALRAVIKCLGMRTQYIILSKGERQSAIHGKGQRLLRVLQEIEGVAGIRRVGDGRQSHGSVFPAQPLAHHRPARQSRHGARLHRAHRARRVRLPRRRPQNLRRLLSYYYAGLFHRSYFHAQWDHRQVL